MKIARPRNQVVHRPIDPPIQTSIMGTLRTTGYVISRRFQSYKLLLQCFYYIRRRLRTGWVTGRANPNRSQNCGRTADRPSRPQIFIAVQLRSCH